MQIDNEFTVGVDIDRAWETLTDLAGIAPCLPGAQLTGREGETYNGKIKIRVGPVISEYAGTALFSSKDEAAYRAVIEAKGKDSRGAGNASATITAQLRGEGARTVVSVSTDLKISGKIAQLGSGMIVEVSKKLLGQFAGCLETKLLTPPPESAAPASAAALVSDPATAARVTVEPTSAEPGPLDTAPTPVPNTALVTDPITAPTTVPTPTAPDPASAATATTPVAAADAATTPAATATTTTTPTTTPTTGPIAGPGPEAEPIDLMAFAGNAAAKRLIPVAATLALVALAYAAGRRHR